MLNMSTCEAPGHRQIQADKGGKCEEVSKKILCKDMALGKTTVFIELYAR